MFNIFLFGNLLCYMLSFLLIIVFAVVVLVGFIRGDPEFINPRRGLNEEEMLTLKRFKWNQYQAKTCIDPPVPSELPEQLSKKEQQKLTIRSLQYENYKIEHSCKDNHSADSLLSQPLSVIRKFYQTSSNR